MKIPYFWIAPGKKQECDFVLAPELWEILEMARDRQVKYGNDIPILISGDNGSGKSTMARELCCAWSYLTGAIYNLDNVFFTIDPMVKFASETTEQIIHQDEFLDSLAASWQDKQHKKLMKMLYLCRKKKHFYVLCFADFFKLKDFIAVDRTIGMVRTYLRNETEYGHAVYYRKKSKQALYDYWRKSGIKSYNKFYSFHIKFPAAKNQILDEDEYDKKKDAATIEILSEPEKGMSREQIAFNEIRFKVYQLTEKLKIKQELLAHAMGINARTLREWAKFNDFSKGKPVLKAQAGRSILISGETITSAPNDDQEGDL